MFEIERVRDRERKIGYSLHKGTETFVRDREKFKIESVQERESLTVFRQSEHFLSTCFYFLYVFGKYVVALTYL